MRGDVQELSIAHETMGDGSGGEKPATVVRVWVEGDEEGELVVSAIVHVDAGAASELDGLRELLEPYLVGFGLGS